MTSRDVVANRGAARGARVVAKRVNIFSEGSFTIVVVFDER